MAILRNFLTFAAMAGLTVALPASISKRQGSTPALTDLQILQFALTLEHLESAFYQQGFAKFPASDFLALGLTEIQIEELIAIGQTENTHVTTLMAVISAAGAAPVQPCTYDFGFTDAAGMVATAKVLEAIGISAYLGAAPLVSDPKILSAAASIVTVEARHQTFIRIALQESPVPQAFDVAIDARQIFTLAAAFIVSCPSGSDLGLQPFPSLNIVNSANIEAGSTLTLAQPGAFPDGSTFCAFSGGNTGTMFAPFTGGQCQVPQGLGGQVYLTISNDGTALSDSSILAGPAVLSFS
ncbi:hypothetical protein RUND412_009456 [Rhizina undulata]